MTKTGSGKRLPPYCEGEYQRVCCDGAPSQQTRWSFKRDCPLPQPDLNLMNTTAKGRDQAALNRLFVYRYARYTRANVFSVMDLDLIRGFPEYSRYGESRPGGGMQGWRAKAGIRGLDSQDVARPSLVHPGRGPR